MGNGCSAVETPNTDNVCSKGYEETLNVQGFCTLAGPAGDGNRGTICTDIAGSEWEAHGTSGNCRYNSANGRERMETTWCCNGGCPIAGSGSQCSRRQFNGNPKFCCLKDLTCQQGGVIGDDFWGKKGPDAPACFDDINPSITNYKATCGPDYRDLGSTTCQDSFFEWCAGTGEVNLQWLDRWTEAGITITSGDSNDTRTMTLNQPCARILHRNLYQKPGSQLGMIKACQAFADPSNPPTAAQGTSVSASGFEWTQRLFTSAVSNYIRNGGRLDAQEGEVGAHPKFNSFVKQICTQTPGLCSQMLQQFCSSATADGMSRHVGTLPWCGCYMPDEQYQKYTDVYQINKECTPMCNNDIAIPLPDTVGTGRKTCTQSICIIDDVSINLARTRIGGGSSGVGINVANICNSCGSASAVTGGGTVISRCDCQLSNITLNAIDSQIGGSVNITNGCRSTECFLEKKLDDGTVTKIPVDCNLGADEFDPYLQQQQELATLQAASDLQRNTKIVWIILAAIGVCVLLWLIFRPAATLEHALIIPRKPQPYPVGDHASLMNLVLTKHGRPRSAQLA